MHSLTTIARSWYLFANGDQETRKLMSDRLAVCDQCPNKRQLGALGKAIVHAINQKTSVYQCGLCGCPLAAMTANPAVECREGRWNKAGTPNKVLQSFFP